MKQVDLLSRDKGFLSEDINSLCLHYKVLNNVLQDAEIVNNSLKVQVQLLQNSLESEEFTEHHKQARQKTNKELQNVLLKLQLLEIGLAVSKKDQQEPAATKPGSKEKCFCGQ